MKSNQKAMASEDDDKKPAAGEESEQPAAKKLKSEILLTDFISKHVLDSKEELKKTFLKNAPYPHGLLEHVFDPNFLRKLQAEIKEHSKVNFKESDLFRVYQSIDFANLNDDSQESMPTVLQLRRLLYSEAWRSFMEGLCHLPPGTISDRVDCACNCHTAGCHLLCHDDVIGTRRISYILYLTERDWRAAEGGALELYDSKMEGDVRIPETNPAVTILPLFNTMAFFTVEPGQSFHAVQEVLGERPRLSLQGWYHAAKAPDNIKDATLQRLKTACPEDAVAAWKDFQMDPGAKELPGDLSDEDKAYLGKYLDATYLKTESIKELCDRFEEDSSVQLRNFFNDVWVDMLRTATTKEDMEHRSVPIDSRSYYEQGISESWQPVGPSHKQRFLEFTGSVGDDKTPETAGEILAYIRKHVLESAPFGRFLKLITSLGVPKSYHGQVRRFRPGLDYTVAHYGLLTKLSVLDATLCFVAGKGEEVKVEGKDAQAAANATDGSSPDENDVIWQSGDVGGFECYIAADDEEEAADEYSQDDDTELLSVSASNNTLSLVYRDPGTMRFVKYVGAQAPSSRWDVAMEYQMTETNDCENGDSKPSAEEKVQG